MASDYVILSDELPKLRERIDALARHGWTLLGPVSYAGNRREDGMMYADAWYVATMQRESLDAP
jgi:hypothetical protein